MHIKYESQIREPLVDGNKDYHQITEDIIRPIEAKPGTLWYVGFFISVALLLFGVYRRWSALLFSKHQQNAYCQNNCKQDLPHV